MAIYELTEEDEINIYKMLFGKHKEEWRDKNGVVCNSDRDIANTLSLQYKAVVRCTVKISTERQEFFNSIVNSGFSDEQKRIYLNNYDYQKSTKNAAK
jgi:hypothetical protein